MGIASQITSVILRAIELTSASIIAGLVGAYLHFVSEAGADANGRFVYTITIAGISIFFSMLFMPPLKYSFYGFPLDFALFICWMVAFGLLVSVCISSSSYNAILCPPNFPSSKNSDTRQQLTGSDTCGSVWYWQSWGYYWGGYYWYIPIDQANEVLVGTAACSKWRATLAWSFIGGWFWLGSAALVSPLPIFSSAIRGRA